MMPYVVSTQSKLIHKITSPEYFPGFHLLQPMHIIADASSSIYEKVN